MNANKPTRKTPGIGYFVSLWPLIAVSLLILNDRVLKESMPSMLTGKLSDITGIFFFPLFLCAGIQTLANPITQVLGIERRCNLSKFHLLLAILSTDLVFAGIKTSSELNIFYIRTLESLIGIPSQVVMDASDLVVIPFANFATWIQFKSWQKREPKHQSSIKDCR